MGIMSKLGLPDPVYFALTNDDYDDGGADYTATTLLSAPQIVQLQRRYGKKEKPMDKFYSLLGDALHFYLEHKAKEMRIPRNKTLIIEDRFFLIMLGKEIGGAVDYYEGGQSCGRVAIDDNGLAVDYKLTSVWNIIYNSKSKDWETQLNIYAYLLREHGYLVDQLQVIAFLRDWIESQAKRERNYPQAPIQILDIPLWEPSKQEMYLHHRLSAHVSNENRHDYELTPCTTEEMWASDTTYAVKKNTNKRAIRCLKTEKEALDYINTVSKKDPKNKYSLEIRPGERKKCMTNKCGVAEHCHQYQMFLKEK